MSRGLGYIEREIVAILKSRALYHHSTLAFHAWRLATDLYQTDEMARAFWSNNRADGAPRQDGRVPSDRGRD